MMQITYHMHKRLHFDNLSKNFKGAIFMGNLFGNNIIGPLQIFQDYHNNYLGALSPTHNKYSRVFYFYLVPYRNYLSSTINPVH